MATTAIGRCVLKRNTLNGAAIVGGHLLFLHGHGQFGIAVMLGQAVRALAQQLAETFAIGRHAHAAHHGGSITKAQGEADVALGDIARFEQLHGTGNGSAQRDGVHALLIANPVGFQHGGNVVYAAVGAKAPARFVFGAFAKAVKLALIRLDLSHATACDGATETALVLHQRAFGQLLAGNLVRVLEHGTIAAVVLGQAAHFVDDVHQDLGAVRRQAGATYGMLAQNGARLQAFLQKALVARNFHAARSANNHGFQVL